MLDDVWYTMDKRPIKDLTVAVIDLCAESDRKVYIGTDAQVHDRATEFVTAVCVLNPGKGGRVFYRRVKHRKTMTIQTKLFKEVELSIQIAQELDKIPALSGNITVHIDSNNKVECGSTPYTQALVGWVVGSGFEAEAKPNAWAASYVSERIVKYKNVVSAPVV